MQNSSLRWAFLSLCIYPSHKVALIRAYVLIWASCPLSLEVCLLFHLGGIHFLYICPLSWLLLTHLDIVLHILLVCAAVFLPLLGILCIWDSFVLFIVFLNLNLSNTMLSWLLVSLIMYSSLFPGFQSQGFQSADSIHAINLLTSALFTVNTMWTN